LIKNRKVKQVGSLYTSMVLGILIGIGVSVVNTRLLGPQQYGDLKFLQNLFAFVVTFLTLGIFVSGSRLLAQKKNEGIKNQLIGNLLILAATTSVVLIIGLFIFSLFEEQIFHNELGRVIRMFSPLLFVFPFQLCLENIMQGDNRIYELSAFRITPSILYFLSAITFNYFIPLSLTSALAIQLGALAIVILIMIIRFKPKFVNMRRNVAIIWKENKTYGFHVYIGFITGVASQHLGGLSVGYFMDNTSVGFFSLALIIAGPLTMIPNAVGTTFFKDFANRNSIPREVTILSLALSLFALLIFLLIIKKLTFFLYTEKYSAVITLAYLASIGAVLHGFGDFINRFLGSHGKGREIRNNNIAICIVNIFGYTILTYAFGLIGAIITRLIAGLTHAGGMYYYYKKYQKELLNNIIEDN